MDECVTHKLWGFPIFFFLMWLMFYCTFNLGCLLYTSIRLAVPLGIFLLKNTEKSSDQAELPALNLSLIHIYDAF